MQTAILAVACRATVASGREEVLPTPLLILFLGAGLWASLNLSTQVTSDTTIDLRYAFVALAGVFGGLGALIVVLAAAVVRLLGSHPELAGILPR